MLLYHWIDEAKLTAALESGRIEPYWTHFVMELGRHAKGVCLSPDHDRWRPDPKEGKRAECLLVLDLRLLSADHVFLNSSETYWLTKDLEEIQNDGSSKWREGTPEAAVTSKWKSRQTCNSSNDECFVLDAVDLNASLVAVGMPAKMPRTLRSMARRAAKQFLVPLLDVSGWHDSDAEWAASSDLVESIVTGQVPDDHLWVPPGWSAWELPADTVPDANGGEVRMSWDGPRGEVGISIASEGGVVVRSWSPDGTTSTSHDLVHDALQTFVESYVDLIAAISHHPFAGLVRKEGDMCHDDARLRVNGYQLWEATHYAPARGYPLYSGTAPDLRILAPSLIASLHDLSVDEQRDLRRRLLRRI